MMIAFIPVVILAVIAVALIAAIIGGVFGDGDIVAVMTALIAIPIVMIAYIVMAIIATPFALRAGLTQDFGESLNVAFAKDFVGKMWKEMLLAGLFLIPVTIVAQIVGLILCFIGIYPAMAWLALVQGHLLWQLYEVYLSRGGEEIPLKAAAPAKPAT